MVTDKDRQKTCEVQSNHLKFVDVYSVRRLKSYPIKHGIAPLKIRRTPFIPRTVIGDVDYWRDLPNKACMLSRLEDYLEERQFDPDPTRFRQAVEIVREAWIDHYGVDLTVAPVVDSYNDLPKSTSAGLPFKSGTRKSEVRNKMIALARRQWNRLKQRKQIQVLPCRAGARCQLRKIGENKPRLIWAYPGYISILENQFLLPIKSVEPPPFMGWSVNWLDQGRSLNRLIYGDKFTWKSLAQIDFSRFDSSVVTQLIYPAFSIFRSLFKLTSIESAMLDQLRFYFIHTPIAMYNSVKVTSRGIPSGSVFTQIIGSIINMIACTYASLMSREYNLRIEYSCWLGDDSFLNFREALCKQEFDDDYLSHFEDLSLIVSSEKTHYVTRFPYSFEEMLLGKRLYAKFLGKQIDIDTLTFHNSLSKLDAQMVLPERPDLSRFETGVRLVGLAWAFGAHFDVYSKILRAYASLKLPSKITINDLIEHSEKPEKTRRNISYFLSTLKYQLNLELDSDEFLSFPTFWTVSNRYFGPRFERLDFRSYKIVELQEP